MTITGPVALSLGDAEKEYGLTFVALSRSTDINNVFLGAGCSLERRTTKISSGFKLKQRLLEDNDCKCYMKVLLHFMNFCNRMN